MVVGILILEQIMLLTMVSNTMRPSRIPISVFLIADKMQKQEWITSSARIPRWELYGLDSGVTMVRRERPQVILEKQQMMMFTFRPLRTRPFQVCLQTM